MEIPPHWIVAAPRACRGGVFADGTAHAAGLPEDKLSLVTVLPETAPVMVNTVDLTRRLTGTFTDWFGKEGLEYRPPMTGAEDFSEFGRTEKKVPLFMWWIGAADPAKFAAAQKAGKELASNHSPIAAFEPDPTIERGVTSFTAAVLDLLARK